MLPRNNPPILVAPTFSPEGEWGEGGWSKGERAGERGKRERGEEKGIRGREEGRGIIKDGERGGGRDIFVTSPSLSL